MPSFHRHCGSAESAISARVTGASAIVLRAINVAELLTH
jgi:hypothetical protein